MAEKFNRLFLLALRIQQFLFRSVRGRLVLLVVAIAAPVGVLATFLILQSYASERAAVAPRLLSTARAICAVVDGEIDEGNAILTGLVATGAIRRDDFKGLEATARRALADDERWFVLRDADGHEKVNTHFPEGATLRPVELSTDFLNAMQQGRPHISNLEVGANRDELLISLSRPFVNEGAAKYFLSLTTTPTTFAHALGIEHYAPGNIITVVDRNGRIVARSRNADKYVGKLATPDVVKGVKEAAEGTIDSVTLEKIPVLAAFSRARCGWSVLIGAPKSELYESARRLLTMALICSGLLTVAAVVLAKWIARALVRSVDAVTQDAETMRHGRMPEIRSSGLEETDFVMTAMRRTAETLLRRTRTLEALNELNAQLIGHRDIDKISQGVTDAARKVSGAEHAFFYYKSAGDSGSPNWMRTTSGTSAVASAPLESAVRPPLFDQVLEERNIVAIDDITTDVRYNKTSAHYGLVEGSAVVRSYIAVPVSTRNSEITGVIFLSHSEAGVFTNEMQQVIVGLAAEAAIAIENAKLYETLERELKAKSKTEAELRIAQMRLQEHAEQLEQKVEERTASLREAITQMEEFSYTVSHDLRSPVRAMNGYATLLIEDYGAQLNEEARGYLQRIQRASERMDQLTTDVLSYSRVARSDALLEKTDVHAVVSSTLEHYAELQPPAADVRVELPLHSVLAHEPSLRQCLANLLTNAVKFVKPGEKPRVVVRTEKKADRVRIWIEDRGIGIPPEFQNKLFRIFERVPLHTNYEGTGVGLAIVRKAAEKMGGSFGVESDGKNGSRFWVELNAG